MEIVAEDRDSEFTPRSHLHLPMQSQIALMFMAVMVMFAVFASLLNGFIAANNFEEELDEEAGQYIQYIFNGYLENVEGGNERQYQHDLKRVLKDKNVLSIALYDKSEEVIYGYGLHEAIPKSALKSNTEDLLVIAQNDSRYYRYSVPASYQREYSQNRALQTNKKANKDIATDYKRALNYIVLGYDGRLVFRAALNSFVWTFALTILAAICMMFISVIVIRNFTKPFNMLSSAMGNAQLGERGVRVVPDGTREVYSMGAAFNSMISVLERREERLITQKKALEEEINIRRKAELALKNTTSRLQAIFQNAVDGIIVVSADYKIVSINPSAEKILGYKPNELEGESFTKIMLEQFIKIVFEICNDNAVVNDGNNYKSVALTKLGNEIPVEIGVSKMGLSEDESYLVIVRDISERIKAEEEINNYQIHLEEMVEEQTKDIADSRDAAMSGERVMSTFLSNMSHELRTPMHGVLGFASIALKKIDIVSAEKTKQYLNEIITSGEHLLDIINDLLDLSKLKSGKMVYNYSDNNFVNLIEDMNREMSILAKDKNLTFDFSESGEVVGVCCDSKRMAQVLRNLYANAIKFASTNSEIKIIADFSDKEYFKFSIFNFGAFVPDDEADVIFDNFSQSTQTETNAGGTGLGLSICKQIVELGHSGKIWSELGIKDGAKFVFKIPLSIEPSNEKVSNQEQHFGAQIP